MGLRIVRDGFETHAMTLRLFCEEFCRIKILDMFKIFANRSRPVRDSCEDIANLCERFTTVLRLVREMNRKTVANSHMPVR